MRNVSQRMTQSVSSKVWVSDEVTLGRPGAGDYAGARSANQSVQALARVSGQGSSNGSSKMGKSRTDQHTVVQSPVVVACIGSAAQAKLTRFENALPSLLGDATRFLLGRDVLIDTGITNPLTPCKSSCLDEDR